MIWRLLLASGAVLCVFPVYKSRQNERAGLSSPGRRCRESFISFRLPSPLAPRR